MAFTELELKLVETVVGIFCENRVPETVRDQIRLEYKVTGQEVLILERRPHWQNPMIWTEIPIAKIRYNRSSGMWKLYWQRGNLKWVSYNPLPESKDLAVLVQEIDLDPAGCFWG